MRTTGATRGHVGPTRACVASIVVLGTFFGAVADGHTASPASVPANAAALRGSHPTYAAGHAPQRQRFEATVSRVRVDVIVRDDGGAFVDDLTAADFRIFEDGDEQRILSVQMVDLPAGVLVDRTAPGQQSPTTALVANADPAAGTPSERSSDFGAMVFLVDFQNLDFRNKLRFTESWENLISETAGLQIPRAVYLIDQVGRLEELAPLTQDPEVLLGAAREVSERSNVRKSLRDERIEDTNPGDEMVRRYRDRDRALYTYELLTQFADGLSARSGRTALVWVSTGVSLMYENAYSTAPAAASGGGRLGQSRPTFGGSPNPMILERQRAFHRAANSANVSVYTVDPTPKIEQALGMADARYGPIAEGGPTPLAGNVGMGLELDAIRNSLRQASADTGGRSFIGWADLTDVLTEIETDTGRYYLLTYAAPEPEGDGDYHDIRVEVLRDDVDVRARDGYFDYNADDRRSRFVSAALSLPGTVADLPLRAQATRSWSADGTATVLLSVAVDADEVGLGVDDEGVVFAGLEIHAAALDNRLDIEEEHHGALRRRLRPRAGGGPGAIAELARIPSLPPGELLVHRAEWSLPPGDYDVRVMAMDETTGRVGSARMAVSIPDRTELGWGTSDLLLIEADATSNPHPVVDGRVPAGRVVSAFLEVYNGTAPAVRGEIRALDNPSSPFADGAEIFFTPLYRDPDGIHRGVIVLPPLRPGAYALQLDVSDPPAGESTTFDARVEVLQRGAR